MFFKGHPLRIAQHLLDLQEEVDELRHECEVWEQRVKGDAITINGLRALLKSGVRVTFNRSRAYVVFTDEIVGKRSCEVVGDDVGLLIRAIVWEGNQRRDLGVSPSWEA